MFVFGIEGIFAAMCRRNLHDRLAALLTLILLVPAASLTSHPLAAWEVGPSGAVPARDISFSDLSVERVTTSSNATSVAANSSLGGDASVDLAAAKSAGGASVKVSWAKRAGAPWSLTATSPSPHAMPSPDVSVGVVLSGMENVQTTSASAEGGGTGLLLVVVILPLTLCICCFLFTDIVGDAPGDAAIRTKNREGPKAPLSGEGRHLQTAHTPKPSPKLQQQQPSFGATSSSLMPQAGPVLPGPSSLPQGAFPQQQGGMPSGAFGIGGSRMASSQSIQQTPSLPPATPLLPQVRQPQLPPPALRSDLSMPPTEYAVLSPVVSKKNGEVFGLEGQILPIMQNSQNIKISIGYNQEPYAVMHINETEHGCGVLLEMHNSPPMAFFDTLHAVGQQAQMMPHSERKVSILHAGPHGLDPLADAVAVVLPSDEFADEVNVFKPGTNSSPIVPLLTVKLGPNGQASRIRTPNFGGARSKIVGMIEHTEGQNTQQLFVYCGMDPVLVLCSIVAAIKIGVQRTA